jgi:transposase
MTTLNVVGGVDTHKDVHVAAVIDDVGRLLGTQSFETSRQGCKSLLRWMRCFGHLQKVGIEGTGSFGSSLNDVMIADGISTVEVNRPNRQERRRLGKTDAIDAELAARAALSGQASAIPKDRSDIVGSLRALRIAYMSLRDSRTRIINQMEGIIVSAPEPLRGRLLHASALERSRICSRFRTTAGSNPLEGVKEALKCLGRHFLMLSDELKRLRSQLDALTVEANPALVSAVGVGPDVASILLVAVGDNPQRLRSEAAFASLCGVAPVSASSGRTSRHRLNAGGNRQANNALWRVVLVRLSFEPRTQSYMERRRAEGKSKREVIRCLKRFVARELFALLTNPPEVFRGSQLRQMRDEIDIKLCDAAAALGLTRQQLGFIEKERRFDSAIAERYHCWLTEQIALANQ